MMMMMMMMMMIPMDVTLLGMVTDARDEHPSKTRLPDDEDYVIIGYNDCTSISTS